MLRDFVASARTTLEQALEDDRTEPRIREAGVVLHVGGGVARVSGLPTVAAEELVKFTDGMRGIAIDLGTDSIGVVLLGPAARLCRMRAFKRE